MKSMIIAAFAFATTCSAAAFAGEITATAPSQTLAVPEEVSAPLPPATASESEALAVPEQRSEATAPYRGCHRGETVYLTN